MSDLERRVAWLEKVFDDLEKRLRAVERKAEDAADLKTVLQA